MALGEPVTPLTKVSFPACHRLRRRSKIGRLMTRTSKGMSISDSRVVSLTDEPSLTVVRLSVAKVQCFYRSTSRRGARHCRTGLSLFLSNAYVSPVGFGPFALEADRAFRQFAVADRRDDGAVDRDDHVAALDFDLHLVELADRLRWRQFHGQSECLRLLGKVTFPGG